MSNILNNGPKMGGGGENMDSFGGKCLFRFKERSIAREATHGKFSSWVSG